MMKGYGYRGVLIFLELDYWSCTSSGARSYIAFNDEATVSHTEMYHNYIEQTH